MKALKVTLLQPDSVDTLRALSRGLGRFIFAASVLVILFAGTFPFDFTFTTGHSTPWDWRWNQYDPQFADRGQNILFFVPFGFGLASIIRTQMNRMQWRMAIAPPASFALSLLVEGLQKFVSFRDPTTMDLWCNTLGGIIGAGIYVQFGDRLLAAAARGMLRLHRFAKPLLIGSITAAYALFHLSAPLLLHDPGDLSGWDPTLPLVVGNEVGGDRPWRGIVREVLLADRAITADEGMKLAHDSDPQSLLGPNLLAHYRIAGDAPYADLTAQLPPLTWANPSTRPSLDPASSPRIDSAHWLTTSAAVESANRRIRESSAVTFAATVITSDINQRGPARLASISGGTTSRNIQLAQEFTELVVRVRSAVRSAPELYVRSVFEPEVPRDIAVTNARAETIVYVDGIERGRMHITPEAKVIWRLYPRVFRIRIEEYGFRAYAAIYRAIVFIPFSALLGATLMLMAGKPAFKLALATGSILAVAILLEVVLGNLGGTFEPINLLISLLIGYGTLTALMLWRSVRDTSD